MRPWQAMLVGATAFAGCGAFLATQNLGQADAYAIVASFFLALLTATASVVTWSKSKKQADQRQHQRQHGTTTVSGCETVVVGDNNKVSFTKKVTMQPAKRRHR